MTTEVAKTKKVIYLFLDEGGNLDFSPSGTKFFTLTTIAAERPFALYAPLSNLRYDLLEEACEFEYFHATEDKQIVRDRVFKVIQDNLAGLRIDSLVVEKSKTGPALREMEEFYPRMMGYLLRFLFEREFLKGFDEVIVITDSIPMNNKRRAIERAVKTTLARMLPSGVTYRVHHYASKTSRYLQVADYCNWAIYRKWENKDLRSYNLIAGAIKSEFDIFRAGTIFYYKK